MIGILSDLARIFPSSDAIPTIARRLVLCEQKS
jgi:hypothetical protein